MLDSLINHQCSTYRKLNGAKIHAKYQLKLWSRERAREKADISSLFTVNMYLFFRAKNMRLDTLRYCYFSGLPVVIRADLIAAGLQSGLRALMKAAAPAT